MTTTDMHDDGRPGERVERLMAKLTQENGPIEIGPLEEVPRARADDRLVVTIRLGQMGRHVTGMGFSREEALFDGLVRLNSSTWRVLECDPADIDPGSGRHEWSWTLVDGVGRRRKRVRVHMDGALVGSTAALLDTPGAAGCLASDGRSAIEEYLTWQEPPDLIEIRPGASPRATGGMR